MKTKLTVAGLVVLFAAVLVLYYLGYLPRLLKANSYQAVFLDNGQVYFGKLYSQSKQYAVLKDVYYLQIAQAPQPINPGEAPPTNINIVKLGGELHGPKDEMRINRDHVLFTENLQPESRVVQAIEQFKAGNK